MVLSRATTTLVPALLVPDEQTWTMSGRDPGALGLEPVFAAARVRRVMVADRLPDVLRQPLQQFLNGVPGDVDRSAALRAHETAAGHHGNGEENAEHEGHGHHAHTGQERHGHDDHSGHEGPGHEAHGGHDHHDMMAIVGEPSADGLVMEPIHLRLGPIGTPLPGGLVIAVTLDGDVVAQSEVSALLAAANGDGVPDRLAPQAWNVALADARDAAAGVTVPPSERWNRIARVEIERALSHMAWLRGFARVLGWPALTERTSRSVAAALEAQRLTQPALEQAAHAVADVVRFVVDSRLLRWRTAGRAVLAVDEARELGVRGPIVRASGLAIDARLDDPLYRRLGFEPIASSEGDALARTIVRVREAAAAIELATRAREAESSRDLGDALPSAKAPGVVEGPRGPLHARVAPSTRLVAAPGHGEALAAASQAVVGEEWSAAVVGLASFDLSPWRLVE